MGLGPDLCLLAYISAALGRPALWLAAPDGFDPLSVCDSTRALHRHAHSLMLAVLKLNKHNRHFKCYLALSVITGLEAPKALWNALLHMSTHHNCCCTAM